MKREKGFPAFGGTSLRRAKAALATERGDQGFTIIEVMITIVILSILLAVSIPAFSRWLPNYRLRGAARDLYSNLQLAKAQAIKDRVECAVQFTSADSYEVWSALDPDTPTQNMDWETPFSASDDTLIKTVTLSDYGSGVTFGAGNAGSAVGGGAITAFPATPIYFNSRGFATNNAEVYTYMTNNKGTAYAVGILVSGAVVLKKWNGQWE